MDKKFRLSENDLEERFITSSGPGGQHLNKTATCVYLKHIPTGIEVKCQKERSQSRNRILAREILLDKIEKRYADREKKKRSEMERQRRQKRHPPRHIRIKRLESKRRHALKKKSRSARDYEITDVQ